MESPSRLTLKARPKLKVRLPNNIVIKYFDENQSLRVKVLEVAESIAFYQEARQKGWTVISVNPFKLSDYISKSEIQRGTTHELEHTKSRERARKIALDHLKEDPKYYVKLAKAGLEHS